MKPQTMVAKIGNIAANLLIGWESKAAFEIYAQVIIDGVLRQHLSEKLRLRTEEDFEVYEQVPNDTRPQHSTSHWPKMREIQYPTSNAVADFHLVNSRQVFKNPTNSMDDVDVLVEVEKNTSYYIELKV